MNDLSKNFFNEFSTLLYWKDVIYQSQNTYGKNRGGFFLCLPNFEEDKENFEIKHGEYRKEAQSSHQKILEGKWGKIKVETEWQENNTALLTKIKIISLKDKTKLLPGLHPYFVVGENFEINIGQQIISKNNLADDKLIILNEETNTAKLITNNKTIQIDVVAQNKNISFSVWSDNKDNYICIEPIINEGLENNFPKYFTLDENNILEIECKIQII